MCTEPGIECLVVRSEYGKTPCHIQYGIIAGLFKQGGEYREVLIGLDLGI